MRRDAESPLIPTERIQVTLAAHSRRMNARQSRGEICTLGRKKMLFYSTLNRIWQNEARMYCAFNSLDQELGKHDEERFGSKGLWGR
jgi:hypothetical protein